MDLSNEFAKDLSIGIGSIARILEKQAMQNAQLEDWMFHLNHQVADTLKLVQAVAKTTPSKKPSVALPVAVGIGIGLYLAKKRKKIELVLDKVEKKASVSAEKAKSGTDAGNPPTYDERS